jgi:hypothetical protein
MALNTKHKITLASIGVVLGILSGVLTIVEKTVNIVAQIKTPKASEVPENVNVEKGFAGRVDKDETKSFARMSK